MRVLLNGSRHTDDDAIIFEFRDNKIIYWREYFDTVNFLTPFMNPRLPCLIHILYPPF